MTKQEKQEDSEGMRVGREFGRRWAKGRPSPRLLRLVAVMSNRVAPLSAAEDALLGHPEFGGSLHQLISELEDTDKAEVYFRVLADSENFTLGFARGALDVCGKAEGNL